MDDVLHGQFCNKYCCQIAAKSIWLPNLQGQADKDLLNDLINRQLINITDTSLDNIEQVRATHFWHRVKRNFQRNFRNFLAAWDLKIEYSGVPRRKSGGKLRCLFSAFFIIYLHVF